MNRLPDCPWHPSPGAACAHCTDPATRARWTFTPFAAIGSPADLVRRFGVAKRRFRHWLLDCTTAPLDATRPWRRSYTPRPALFLDTK